MKLFPVSVGYDKEETTVRRRRLWLISTSIDLELFDILALLINDLRSEQEYRLLHVTTKDD